MNESIVSVIMPAYNAELYIHEAINSVIAQTYTNWELIIVDDGSTDNTHQIVKSLAQKDSRIIYLYQKNAKQATARNNGINHAKGSILAFLDSDDLWLSTKLEKSLKHFDVNKFDLFFTNSYFTNESSIDLLNSSYSDMNVEELEYSGTSAIVLFIEKNRIPFLTVLVKKSVLDEVGGFDESFAIAEDYDLWHRLLKHGSCFKSISIPLSIYRLHESSSTSLDRFATDSVMQSIAKNFTPKELAAMKVEKHLRKWIIRWIDFYLNEKNIPKLKSFFQSFNLNSIFITALFLSNKFLGLILFKRLLRKIVKS